MEYIYHCKKNGLDYSIDSEIAPSVSNDYAWRRGVREYLDNYHASVTRKGWTGTDDEFADEIDQYVTEAVTRFNDGEVPGERAPSSPKRQKLAKTAKELEDAGVDADALAAVAKTNPKGLAEFLAQQSAAGRAA